MLNLELINRRNMEQETARKRWPITEAYGIEGKQVKGTQQTEY